MIEKEQNFPDTLINKIWALLSIYSDLKMHSFSYLLRQTWSYRMQNGVTRSMITECRGGSGQAIITVIGLEKFQKFK